jgi:protein-disulfide isomerase
MRNRSLVLTLLVATALADTPLAFNRLPAAVQTAAKQQVKGAKIISASQETENGQSTCDVETKLYTEITVTSDSNLHHD